MDDIPSGLVAHGEAFMALFEDDRPKQSKAKARDAAPEAQRSAKSAAAGPGSQPGPAQSKRTKQKAPKGTSAATQGAGAGDEPAAGHSAGVLGSKGQDSASQGKKRKRRDDIDQILTPKRPLTLSAASTQQQTAKTATQPVASRQQTASATTPRLSKQERKLFMSAKASKVHEAAAPRSHEDPSTQQDSDDEMHLSPQEFKAIQLEVEKFGASALDKRERKKWQASMVTRIGGRPDKAPRTPAAIGKGVAVKSGVREARQLEEAMQAGMVKRKGYNKKKRLEAERNRDLGLNELGRSYKAGMLKFKKHPLGRGPGGPGMNPVKGRGGGGGGKKKGRKSQLKLPF